MSFADLLRVPPGTPPDLEAIDTRATPNFDGTGQVIVSQHG